MSTNNRGFVRQTESQLFLSGVVVDLVNDTFAYCSIGVIMDIRIFKGKV